MCKIESDFRSLIRQKAKNKSKNKDFENNKRDLGKESHDECFFQMKRKIDSSDR